MIFGLSYLPQSSDVDFVKPNGPVPNVHFTEMNQEILIKAYTQIKNPKVIVEIGVDWANDPMSSTSILLRIKSPDCIYIGIDLKDITLSGPNVYFLRQSSSDRQKVYALMESLGHKQIDFAFIDGWHSINQVINDWQYWERMHGNGIMAFHDTNYHPGPVELFKAINRSMFSVERYGVDQIDWGIGIVKRIENV